MISPLKDFVLSNGTDLEAGPSGIPVKNEADFLLDTD